MSDALLDTRCTVATATVDDLALGLRSRPDRERRASRVALRRAVRQLVGAPVAIDIRHRTARPPTVRVRHDPRARFAISLAHRDGRTAAAAAFAGARLGVDVERLDAVAPGHERFFLSARERERVPWGCASWLWALKEAAWKALQLDDRSAFQELELQLDVALDLRGIRLGGRSIPARATLSEPWPGYGMATVVVGDPA